MSRIKLKFKSVFGLFFEMTNEYFDSDERFFVLVIHVKS